MPIGLSPRKGVQARDHDWKCHSSAHPVGTVPLIRAMAADFLLMLVKDLDKSSELHLYNPEVSLKYKFSYITVYSRAKGHLHSALSEHLAVVKWV